MAVESTRFDDPTVLALASSTEQKLGLPPGLLVGVITRGERSNSDQVSSAGARGLGQIIPATRKAAINKYGIDPYLSNENSLDVAGRLLQDSLKRSGGDVSQAVAEYHGGTDPANWGPKTKAYVQRVVGALPAPVADPAASTTTTLPPGSDSTQSTPAGQSTFDRVSAALGKPAESAMANVFKAYQSGQMPAADAKQFETDVRAGRVMLPRGAQLNGDAPAAGAGFTLPAAVLSAYRDGSMPDADKAQLENDVRSGLVKLPAGAELSKDGISTVIPGNMTSAQMAASAPPAQSLGDKIVGSGEAALATATGATTGALGGIVGGANQMGQDVLNWVVGNQVSPTTVQQAAQQGAEALTYAPRTAAGQDIMQEVVAPAMQNLVPLVGLAGSFPNAAGAAAEAIKPTAQIAAATVPRVMQAVRAADLGPLTSIPRRALGALRSTDEAAPTAGTLGSAGAAGTDMAAQRVALAQSMDPPLNLTKGQASRDPAQLKFELETAKMPAEGTPLRQRVVEQNDGILRNFDNLVDQTGAEAPTLRAVGQSVDQALVKQMKSDKTRVRAAYKDAEAAGEMEAPVNLQSVVDHLNESAPDAATAPLLDVARRRALQLGLAVEDGGQLVAQPVTLKTAETFRQAIGRATDFEPTNVRQSSIIKSLVDEATAGEGGVAYRRARAMHSRFAQTYEDRAVVAKLLNNKRGMADRQVALEDVFDHTILKGSLDDVRQVHKVLGSSGPEGSQAWRELRGQTLRWLRDESTKNVATDASGARVLSPAALDKSVRNLDSDGKLDHILGKQLAQRIRDINDLAQYAKTVPPETAANAANTAATLLSAFADIGISGITGTPAPIATGVRLAMKHIKDVKLRNRISDALNEIDRKAPGKGRSAQSAPGKKTIH